MDRLIGKVERMLRQHHMIPAGDTVIVGVSGGADSVCLLLALKELSGKLHFQVRAVHVEHGIRGQESLDDQRYVEELCDRNEIPLRVFHVDIPSLCRESGRTEEEEARDRRYRLLFEEARKAEAGRVAVAHNLQDQAETVLFHLARGSSLAGLCGMRPVRQLCDGRADDADPAGGEILLIRPLLGVSREEIEDWLQEHGASWKWDRTNADVRFARNRIRHNVMPELEQISQRAAEHICRTAEDLAQIEDYLAVRTREACEGCLQVSVSAESPGSEAAVRIDRFLMLDEIIRRRVLREAVRAASPQGSMKDVGQRHVEALMHLCMESQAREADLPGGLWAVRDGGVLRICLQQKDGLSAGHGRTDRNGTGRGLAGDRRTGRNGTGRGLTENGRVAEAVLHLPFEGVRTLTAGGIQIQVQCGQAGPELFPVPQKRYTKWLAYDTIFHDLCFRTRRAGDYLTVNRAGGRKSLSDYLTDRKVPRNMRDRILVAAQGSHVLWVMGMRISERARLKVSDRYVRISLPQFEQRDKEGMHEGDYPCADSGG